MPCHKIEQGMNASDEQPTCTMMQPIDNASFVEPIGQMDSDDDSNEELQGAKPNGNES
jgi:hypothetical protein